MAMKITYSSTLTWISSRKRKKCDEREMTFIVTNFFLNDTFSFHCNKKVKNNYNLDGRYILL